MAEESKRCLMCGNWFDNFKGFDLKGKKCGFLSAVADTYGVSKFEGAFCCLNCYNDAVSQGRIKSGLFGVSFK